MLAMLRGKWFLVRVFDKVGSGSRFVSRSLCS